uniref:Uncharacterized protein n=1 Tax=Oryza punctata TaxID=4537 RepID=A0A0E0M786_ORYPU
MTTCGTSSWRERWPEGGDNNGGGIAGSSDSEEMTTTTEMERWPDRVDGEEGAPVLAELGEGVDEGELDHVRPVAATVQQDPAPMRREVLPEMDDSEDEVA